MMQPSTLVSEEPIRPNPDIDAVDESSQRIVLAEFPVAGPCRYSFHWPRATTEFHAHAAQLISRVTNVFAGPMHCIGGWHHDAQTRTKIMMSRLSRAGWQLNAKLGLGLASIGASGGAVADSVGFLRDLRLGWFVGFGAWCALDELSVPPLETTMRFFCHNQRLAPSAEFLMHLHACGGGLAYAVSSDDRLPTVVVVSSVPIGDALNLLVGASPQ